MSHNNLSDEQLLAQIATGNQAAFETFYQRYAAAVMGLAMKITSDRVLSEEVVQETFWRVWCQAASFRGQRGTALSWLFGIARNLAIDFWRRRQARPQVNESDSPQPFDDYPDPNSNLPELTWVAIKHGQVHSALETLPPEQRKVIELAYFQGLTRQEIAKTVGDPLGTIHTRARLALQKLRQLLQAWGVDE